MTTKVLRLPGRVYFYITGTGWYQGQDNAHVMGGRRELTRGELLDDLETTAMVELIRTARTNADGSLSLTIDATWQLDYLAKEADHALNAASWGDNTPDDLADRAAARALARRVDALRAVPFTGEPPKLPEPAPEPVAPELPVRTCEGCGDELVGKRPDARTCSARCRQVVSRRDRVRPAPKVRTTVRLCSFCREELTSSRALTCSTRCRSAMFRRRGRQVARTTRRVLRSADLFRLRLAQGPDAPPAVRIAGARFWLCRCGGVVSVGVASCVFCSGLRPALSGGDPAMRGAAATSSPVPGLDTVPWRNADPTEPKPVKRSTYRSRGSQVPQGDPVPDPVLDEPLWMTCKGCGETSDATLVGATRGCPSCHRTWGQGYAPGFVGATD